MAGAPWMRIYMTVATIGMTVKTAIDVMAVKPRR
jgi:hypothetical protein